MHVRALKDSAFADPRNTRSPIVRLRKDETADLPDPIAERGIRVGRLTPVEAEKESSTARSGRRESKDRPPAVAERESKGG